MMSLEQLVQLYAPLVGLLAVVFWLGVLSQRVKALEATAPGALDLKVEMARLASTMEALAARVAEMKEDNHTALKEMREDYDKVVGELNHIIRNRVWAESVPTPSTRNRRNNP